MAPDERDLQSDFGFDPLTGALSPTKFNEILEREIMKSKRAKISISVLTISFAKSKENPVKEFGDTNSAINQDSVIKSDSKLNVKGKDVARSELRSVLNSEIIDELMVRLVFELRKILRETDCICRINMAGLWILITKPPISAGERSESAEVVLNRVKNRSQQVLNEYLQELAPESNYLQTLTFHEIEYRGEGYLDFLTRIDESFF